MAGECKKCMSVVSWGLFSDSNVTKNNERIDISVQKQ